MQLRDVYGDSVDKVIQGNTANIVFLKSTDDDMIKTLSGMSGVTHRARISSKSVTRDMQKLLNRNEGKASYTMSTVEEPVITYNDLAFISPRNSIIFRAGNSPIWNRNETVLPMSWRLLKDDIKHPGADFTLQTVPTLSSAKEFDVRKNQPDFEAMLEKRKKQALMVSKAKDLYKEIHNMTDAEISLLDPQVYSDEIMSIVQNLIEEKEEIEREEADRQEAERYAREQMILEEQMSMSSGITENEELQKEITKANYEKAQNDEKRYAGRTLSKSDLYDAKGGGANHQYDAIINKVYTNIRGFMDRDSLMFVAKDGNLYDSRGETLFIESQVNSSDYDALRKASKDPNSNVYAEGEVTSLGTYRITDDFYKFLASLNSWNFANGKFEEEMKKEMAPE